MSDPIYRRFIKDNVVVGAANLSSQMLGVLLIPLVIKTAGTAVYGAYALITSVLALAMLLSSLGIGYRYRRYLPVTEEGPARAQMFFPAAGMQFFTVALGATVLAICFPRLATFLFKEEVPLSRGWIPVFCLASIYYNLAGEYFRYTHRMAVYCAAAVVGNVVYVVLILALVAAGVPVGLELLLGAQILNSIAVGSVLWIMVLREAPLRLATMKTAECWADIKLGFPVVLSSAYEQINGMGDRYVISIWLSVAAVGLYAPACALGSIILLFPRIVSGVLPQLLVVAVDGPNRGTAGTLLSYSVRSYLLIGLPAVAGSAVLAVPALELLANQEVAAACRHVVPLIAATSVFGGLGWILNSMLFVEKRTAVTLWASLASGVLKILLSILALVWHTGLVGVAVAALVAQLSGFAVIACRVKGEAGLVIGPAFLIKIVVASVAMFALLRLTISSNVTGANGAGLLAALVALGIAVYVGCLLLLRTFSTKEFGFIKRLFVRRVSV